MVPGAGWLWGTKRVLILLPLLMMLVQGIDLIAGGRNKKTARTAPKSDNVYLKLLVKVRSLARASSWCCAAAVGKGGGAVERGLRAQPRGNAARGPATAR